MPKSAEESTRAWIEKRYGRISVKKVTLYVALVPVMGGIASGEGTSEVEAIESLYRDLTMISGPADAEPKPVL